MLHQLSYYSFFTKYSQLDHYGFTSGIVVKSIRKIVPVVPREGSFEFYLRQVDVKKYGVAHVATEVVASIANEYQADVMKRELHQAIAALLARVVAIGLDQTIADILQQLSLDITPFLEVVQPTDDPQDTIYILQEIEITIATLRQNKMKVGTSIHLTTLTQELLHYANRAKDLLQLAKDIHVEQAWQTLIVKYLDHQKQRNSIRKHVSQHLDLLALEIVEHTSQKGESYIAENNAGIKKFFVKGLIGGAIIAVFALFKLYIYKSFDSNIQLAFWYSLNYAACFIIVKLVGGTIATKQPAMTASTIIKHIDNNNDLIIDGVEQVIVLLRKVSRSQIISLLGNFVMALSLAIGIGALLQATDLASPVNVSKADSLIRSVSPLAGGAIIFAAIAGCFLALAGLISGYVDNKVVASRLPYRLLHHRGLSYITTAKIRQRLGSWSLAKLGGMAGNIALGFMLGCAWLLTYILPFEVDIRHIAFSSSNVGYAIGNTSFDLSAVALSLVFVLLIGFVNFIVSFSLTLLLALKSRGTTIAGLGRLLLVLPKDLITHPLSYIWDRDQESTTNPPS